MTDWKSRIVGLNKYSVSDLLAHPFNARRHPANQREALRGSLDTLGIVGVPIQNVRTKTLLDGHARVEEYLTRDEHMLIDVLDVDLAEHEEALFLASFDWISQLATYDRDALDTLLKEVQTDDARLQAMLTEMAVQNDLYIEEPVAEDPGAQIDRAEALAEQYGTALGQVWQLGRHRLAIGDCTDKTVVDALMQDKKARCIWTDPPYGVGHSGGSKDPRARTYRSGDKLQNDDLSEVDTETLITDALTNIYSHAEIGASIYVACPPGRLHRRFMDAMDNSGFPYHQGLVWAKDTFVFGRSDYHYRHEPILYGWKNDGGHYFIDDRTQDTIFEVPRPTNSQEEEGHPTSKPVELVLRTVKNSAKTGEVVYDPFLGSGTTLIAAHQTGRVCYGCEIHPPYAAVIIQRWETMTGEKAQRMTDTGLTPELDT